MAGTDKIKGIPVLRQPVQSAQVSLHRGGGNRMQLTPLFCITRQQQDLAGVQLVSHEKQSAFSVQDSQVIAAVAV